MTLPRSSLGSVVDPRLRLPPGSIAKSLLAVEERLASAERELRIQFTRIAQLQAELDLVVAALQRATDVHATSLRVECLRLNTGS